MGNLIKFGEPMSENSRDDRLTDEQQFAVIGHCMRDPRWFVRIKDTLPAQYFMNLKARALYGYVCKLYESQSKPISVSELKACVKQEQSDENTIKIFCEHVNDTQVNSATFTTSRLIGALQKQRLYYEYLTGLNEVAKHAGTGNKEKTLEAVKTLAALAETPNGEQPTTEENLSTLEEEELRWERSLKCRVPFISPLMNAHFMLIPGITLIGGVTKSGKSTVLANLVPPILDHFQDKKVFIITNEDNLDLVATRIACCVCSVPLREYRFEQFKLTAEQVAMVKQAKRAVATRIIVASMPHYDTSNMEVVQELLEEAKSENYSAILLDYYQIVANSKRHQAIEYVGIMKKFGTWLKGYAADLTIPMVVFAQLKPMADGQDTPFSQRVQADQTIANHVHVALEIARTTDDLGHLTNLICHLSRHGDSLGKISTFRYKEGQLLYQPKT